LTAKRSRVEMYLAVLDSLCQEGARAGIASPTHVARNANIPYDRFLKILDQLIKSELVRRIEEGLIITQKGLRCLHRIHKENEFLKRMGLLNIN
jgi:predicted transcriptional regulator